MRLLRALAAYFSLTVFASAQILTPQFPPGVFDNAAATSGSPPVTTAPQVITPLLSGNLTPSTTQTQYIGMGQGQQGLAFGTEGDRQAPAPVPGVISNVQVNLQSAVTGTSYTYSLRVNGAASSPVLSCTISTGNSTCTTPIHGGATIGAAMSSNGWSAGATSIVLNQACSTLTNLAANDWLYDSTYGAQIGQLGATPCTGSTLSLASGAAFSSKPGSSTDNLTASIGVAVTAGQLLDWQVVPNSPVTNGIATVSSIFVPNDNVSIPLFGGTMITTASTTAVQFGTPGWAYTIGGCSLATGTYIDYGCSIFAPEALTVTALYINAIGGASNGGWYAAPVVNGAPQTAIQAQVTATQGSATGSVSVPLDATLSVQLCPDSASSCPTGAGAPGVARFLAWGMAVKPVTGTQPFLAANGLTIGTAGTKYLSLETVLGNSSSTQGNYFVLPVPMSLGKFLVAGCYGTAGSSTPVRTFSAQQATSTNNFQNATTQNISGMTSIASWNPSTVPGVGPPNTNYACSGTTGPTSWDLVTTGNWNLNQSAAGTVAVLQNVPSSVPDTLTTFKTSTLLTMQGP